MALGHCENKIRIAYRWYIGPHRRTGQIVQKYICGLSKWMKWESTELELRLSD